MLQLILFFGEVLFEIAYCVQSKYSTHCVKLKHEVILVFENG